MKLKLTMRNVADAKPDAKPYELRDTDTRGLLLRVQPSGVKSFIVEWTRGRRSTLGRFPELTLEGARKRTRKAMAEVDTLGAPAAVIEAAKPVAGKVETFGDFMALYKPHLEATAKAGKATADCIKSVFGLALILRSWTRPSKRCWPFPMRSKSTGMTPTRLLSPSNYSGNRAPG
jgi:hypothetical protein